MEQVVEENSQLEEKLLEVEGKIKITEESNKIVQENQREIENLEKEISRIQGLIEVQNKNNEALVNLDSEIASLNSRMRSSEITNSESNYLRSLMIEQESLKKKNSEVLEKIWVQDQYDIEERKSTRDSLVLVKESLKSETLGV